ncbi:MAG: GNAT family N-acetyltransferase [Deltaproteobacteria bacterium]|nr:GNAT family N-acetyltransferase [Deltaproteobacteria bacterium]
MAPIEYRDFDGNVEALGAMAADSWNEEYGINTWPDLYRPDLARHFFSCVDDPRYLVGAYDGIKLVAFIANLPRTYRFQGQRYKGALSCMLVGHKEYRRQGIIIKMIKECLLRNEDLGCDFTLLTLEKKHRSAFIFDKHLKPNHRIELIKTLHPVTRPIDLAKVTQAERLKRYEIAAIKLFGAHRPIGSPKVPGSVRPYQRKDLGQILELTGRYSDEKCLVRIFDEKTLSDQLDTAGVTTTVVYERDGRIGGFLNFTYNDLVGLRGRQRWAWLDFLYWEGLKYKEKKALLAELEKISRAAGCIGILEWNKGYYANGPLYRSRFIFYPRYIDLNAWIFNPNLSFKGMKSIFEQQI